MRFDDYRPDDLDWLEDVTYFNDDTEVFTMDTLGNRTSVVKRDTNIDTYALDSDTNSYDKSTGGPYDVTCAYDDAGNMSTDKDDYTYEYENRLVKIEDSSSVEVATFDEACPERSRRDALGRRIRKSDKSAQSMVLYYYSPEWQVLAEYNGSNNLQRYFIYGNYIDEPLVMSDGTDDYYYVQDHLYSTIVKTCTQTADAAGVRVKIIRAFRRRARV